MKNPLHVLILAMLLLSFLQHQNLQCQTISTNKHGIYKTWVDFIDNSKTKGYLSDIGDSLIGIYNLNRGETEYFKIENINSLQFRKQGNIVKGFLWGTLAGFAIGGIIGLALGDDPGAPDYLLFTAKQKGVICGILGSGAGFYIGALICTVKSKVPINGNYSNYKTQKEKLEKYKY